MIDKGKVVELVEEFLKDTDCFLIDVNVSEDNDIVVEIDSDSSVDIDTCCDLNRYIEENLSRDVEDYSLEVGSAGLTANFKLPRQYRKNIGNEIEVLCKGKKMVGVLKDVSDEGFTIVANRGKKNSAETEQTFLFEEVTYAKYYLKFK